MPKLKPANRDDIKVSRDYLAKIYGGWYAGRFNRQWWGWNFINWGMSGIDLKSIEELYEIEE